MLLSGEAPVSLLPAPEFAIQLLNFIIFAAKILKR